MNQALFQNKTVIITGASAGVGAACARNFAELGANLVLAARGQTGLDTIKAELECVQGGGRILTVAMDVADNEACKKLIERSVEEFGTIHVLVNNAGLHYRGEFLGRAADEIAAMVDVNVRAPFFLTSLALPHIVEAAKSAGVSDSGCAVVMVGSLAGRAPLQGAAAYSATKAGLRAFTYALADELRDAGVSVGVVSPGPIDTGFIMDEIDNVEDIVYSQPMSTAKGVADSVVRLARGETLEIAMPWFSGKLTTIGYLLPRFRRATRGILYAIGRKNKEKYRNRV